MGPQENYSVETNNAVFVFVLKLEQSCVNNMHFGGVYERHFPIADSTEDLVKAK